MDSQLQHEAEYEAESTHEDEDESEHDNEEEPEAESGAAGAAVGAGAGSYSGKIELRLCSLKTRPIDSLKGVVVMVPVGEAATCTTSRHFIKMIHDRATLALTPRAKDITDYNFVIPSSDKVDVVYYYNTEASVVINDDTYPKLYDALLKMNLPHPVSSKPLSNTKSKTKNQHKEHTKKKGRRVGPPKIKLAVKISAVQIKKTKKKQRAGLEQHEGDQGSTFNAENERGGWSVLCVT